MADDGFWMEGKLKRKVYLSWMYVESSFTISTPLSPNGSTSPLLKTGPVEVGIPGRESKSGRRDGGPF